MKGSFQTFGHGCDCGDFHAHCAQSRPHVRVEIRGFELSVAYLVGVFVGVPVALVGG